MDDWSERDRASRAFWIEYVTAARAGSLPSPDDGDQMRVAMDEWFSKIDQAVAQAMASGCVFFNCKQSSKEFGKIRLLFSDGKGRAVRRTLKIDARFHRNGALLEFHDFSNLKIVVQSMIINEGKVRPDPKGGWIAPV